MNIFYLDEDVTKCSQYHVDRHVVKMIVETAQILSTAHHLVGSWEENNFFYKPTHIHHPCVLWAAESVGNYDYLCRLGLALCREYSYRYERVHATQERLMWLAGFPIAVDKIRFTRPPKCMPEHCKENTVVNSYRKYYLTEKRHILKWKNRPIPGWVK